jgi:Subtilase family
MTAAEQSTTRDDAERGRIRQYFLLRSDEEIFKAYKANAIDDIVHRLVQTIRVSAIDAAFKSGAARVVLLPSRRWRFDWRGGTFGEGLADKAATPDDGLIVTLDFAETAMLERFLESARETLGKSLLAVGADPAFAPMQFWAPGEGGQSLFATRAEAEALMRIDYLRRKGRRGRGVNVVVVDQGLTESRLPNFGGRWYSAPPPQGGWGSAHGDGIAHNILAIAPEAMIYDLPLIPPAIADIPRFVSDAQAAFETVRHDIDALRTRHGVRGPWVIVNAWGLFDRRTESPFERYSDNARHPFNVEVAQFDAQGIDVVFAAGNCGQFCPHPRCGHGDRGPGNSILGANALPTVLTVGAVACHQLWLGYSSQGPGPGDLAVEKPDLCAPSQFHEPADARSGNTGTSTASALAAGVVAALRSKWDSRAVSPETLRGYLRGGARRPDGRAAPDRRLGYGIIDARAAFRAARGRHP